MSQETVIILCAVAVLILAAVVALRAGRRPASDPVLATLAETTARLTAAQSEMGGRLSQMAEQAAAADRELAERLQGQERQISKALEEKLSAVGLSVQETLKKSTAEAAGTMNDLKIRLALIDEAQKNIAKLSTQVVGLQDILSNKQARGAFGEVQLQDIVTAVLPPQAYAFQATLAGGRRVDCLLHLPNPPGPIAIDAKFPLESYRALRAAVNDTERQQAGRKFAADVLKHIRDIADRYIVPGETAESALMFLPSEAVYAELHANFHEIVDKGYRARVWIVSPTTLMATLNTVRAVLKDVRMREQAGVIQAEVQHLLGDIQRLDDRVGKLQRHFGQANEDLRQIRISTDKVTRRGERIEELQLEDGAAADETLPAPVRRLAGE
ncbi:MAG: DNA recombination protein RmuC [Inquilinaceae bacterium]